MLLCKGSGVHAVTPTTALGTLVFSEHFLVSW